MSNDYRYSDEELLEFRELILNKIEKAQNLKIFHLELANGSPNADSGTNPGILRTDNGDSSSQKDENLELAERQDFYIKNLKLALDRINKKTFGICRESGFLIPKERLRAVPTTTLSIKAKIFQN